MVDTFKGSNGSSICGKSRAVCAQSATKRLPRSRDGIAITSSGDQKEDQTPKKIAYCFTQRVINKFIAKDYRDETASSDKEGG